MNDKVMTAAEWVDGLAGCQYPVTISYEAAERVHKALEEREQLLDCLYRRETTYLSVTANYSIHKLNGRWRPCRPDGTSLEAYGIQPEDYTDPLLAIEAALKLEREHG